MRYKQKKRTPQKWLLFPLQFSPLVCLVAYGADENGWLISLTELGRAGFGSWFGLGYAGE